MSTHTQNICLIKQVNVYNLFTHHHIKGMVILSIHKCLLFIHRGLDGNMGAIHAPYDTREAVLLSKILRTNWEICTGGETNVSAMYGTQIISDISYCPTHRRLVNAVPVSNQWIKTSCRIISESNAELKHNKHYFISETLLLFHIFSKYFHNLLLDTLQTEIFPVFLVRLDTLDVSCGDRSWTPIPRFIFKKSKYSKLLLENFLEVVLLLQSHWALVHFQLMHSPIRLFLENSNS